MGGADAVLAASIFHRREFTLGEAKAYMAAHGVRRPPGLTLTWRAFVRYRARVPTTTKKAAEQHRRP